MSTPHPSADDEPLPPADEPESVGTASMEKDGTLKMQLRTQTDRGLIGEMLMTVAPADERYAGYLAHLGGLQPGQAKPIPPFPAPAIDPDSI